VKLGVIAALSQELGPTLRAIPTTTRTVDHLKIHESPSLVFAAGGIGARPAAAAALLVADRCKPDGLLSIGFCGALSDDLETADLLLGGTSNHPAADSLLTLAREAAPKARTGSVVTVDKVLLGADEKRALAKKSGALVVDMEADAVALAAKARGLGFLAVKIVIDTPSAPLSSTYTGCWTVLRDLLRGSLMGMIHDSKRVKLAAERLRDFFVALNERTK
jgi:nucleoside phosphorylase